MMLQLRDDKIFRKIKLFKKKANQTISNKINFLLFCKKKDQTIFVFGFKPWLVRIKLSNKTKIKCTLSKKNSISSYFNKISKLKIKTQNTSSYFVKLKMKWSTQKKLNKSSGLVYTKITNKKNRNSGKILEKL